MSDEPIFNLFNHFETGAVYVRQILFRIRRRGTYMYVHMFFLKNGCH